MSKTAKKNIKSEKTKLKKCSSCPEEINMKPLNEFGLCRGKYRSQCKKCCSEYNKNYKIMNKKHIKKYNKNYNKTHRKEIQKRQTETRNRKKINDFEFYIAEDLRSKLCKYIKSRCTNYVDFMEKLINCSSEKFMLWLIYQFDENMTFSNYGQYWTIDHVSPVSSFNLTDINEINQCFFWMNLRPLIKIYNNNKSNKTNINDEIEHINIIKKFEKEILPNFKLTN